MTHFTGYGKNAMKAHKASPDAWAQMVKQLAFYRSKGRPGVVYESCQTRKFLYGRTEVIRSLSAEALAFVKAMEDPKSTPASREKLFRAAVSRHIQYSTWAADAQGVDRHMFGLRMLVDKKQGEEMPEVFKEEVFSKSSHWEMSTSQLSSKYLDGWGYGEGQSLPVRWTMAWLTMGSRGGRLRSVVRDQRRFYPVVRHDQEQRRRAVWRGAQEGRGGLAGYDGQREEGVGQR